VWKYWLELDGCPQREKELRDISPLKYDLFAGHHKN
jgi:hypothetical protein